MKKLNNNNLHTLNLNNTTNNAFISHKWPINMYFRFKMFRSSTRFLKYKLTYTNFFREKTILRLRRTLFKIYVNIVSIWVNLFQNSKHKYNFLQTYSMFNVSVYLPFINPIINNFVQLSSIVNHYPLTPLSSITKNILNSRLYTYTKINSNTKKIKISMRKKIFYSKFLLILQLPYNLAKLFKVKNHYELTQLTLLLKSGNLVTSSITKPGYLNTNPFEKDYNFYLKNLTNILVKLVMSITSLYRKVFIYTVVKSLSWVNTLPNKIN